MAHRGEELALGEVGLLGRDAQLIETLHACDGGDPAHETDGQEQEAAQEADDLLEERLDLGVTDHHEAVEALEVVADVQEAGEEQEEEAGDDEAPSATRQVGSSTSRIEQVDEDAAQHRGSRAL